MNKKDLVTISAAAFAILTVVMLFVVREKGLRAPIDQGKPFRCAIGFKKDIGGADGHKILLAGLNYDLLKEFSEEKSLSDSIFAPHSDVYDWADSLRKGSLDLVVLPFEDSLPILDGIFYSVPIDSVAVWAIGCNYKTHLEEIDGWLASLPLREDFEERIGLFFDTVNPGKDAAKGIRSDHLSPYDDLFKEFSHTLGWDWRLMAAVAYNESRFSILSHSPKGASGIMQIKPSSAKRYGVSDLLDPRENIYAGAHHFAALQKRYRSSSFSPEDRIRFTLAAYNAGSKRVHGYMETADSLSLDKYSWEDVSSVSNSMTVSYVDSVFSTYEAICRIVDR